MGKGERPPSTAEELREATRAANELLRDIRTERKALEELRAAVRKELDDAHLGAHEFMRDAAVEASSAGAQALAEDLQRAQAMIFRRFDQIASLLLAGRNGGPDVEKMVTSYVSALSPDDREKLASETRRILVKDEAPTTQALSRLLGND